MRSLARSIFMQNPIIPPSQANTYTIGLIIDPDRIIRKHRLIKGIISYIIDNFLLKNKALRFNIIIPLRNECECALAQQIIETKNTFPNLYLTALIPKTKEVKPIHSSLRKHLDIVSSADGHHSIEITYRSMFYSKSTEILSRSCNVILYNLRFSWQISLLQTLTHKTKTPTLSVQDII